MSSSTTSSSQPPAGTTPTSDKKNDNNNIQIVPVLDEKFSISKKVITQDFTIEKRMVEGIATIEVPVKYEEIYVNGKKFGSGSSLDNIMSTLKSAITPNMKKGKSYEKEKLKKKRAELKGDLIPLSEYGEELEKVFPLFGEEITIKKKMRKVGEAVITKRKVTEKKKFKIETRGEKIMIKYPDGTERTLESTAPSPSLTTTTTTGSPITTMMQDTNTA